MKIQTYDEVDPFEVYKLGMIAFGWAITPKYVEHRLREDPRIMEGFAIYAMVGGEVVSQVVPLKMQVHLTSGVETVGGVQGVCSLPSVWGKGYAWRLMEKTHEIYREQGFRISTLATSRNIRGYGIYRGLGYVDIGPMRRAARQLPDERRKPKGLRLRKASKEDLPAIQGFFRDYTKDMYGYTERDPRLLPMKVSWDLKNLDSYRMVVKGDSVVGYVRIASHSALTDEVIVPDEEDFGATVRLLESSEESDFVSVPGLTSTKDQERFRSLGYNLYGPMMGTAMALSLDVGLDTWTLPDLFGDRTGEFVFYATDGF